MAYSLNYNMMKDRLGFGRNSSRKKMGMNPKMKKGEKWRTSIWGFSKREEFTPLGGGSKISEEDPPL